MRKKDLAAAVLLVAVVAALIYFAFSQFSRTAENPASRTSAGQMEYSSGTSTNSAGSATANSSQEKLAANAGELPPPPPVATNIPPLIILQNARQAIIQYAQVYGGNPVGTNPEITAALLGTIPST